MEISLDQARAFCAVVDLGSYTKAADKLYKSHSSLIYLIKGLERECGFSLFNRKSYRNTLTTSGRRVYHHCLEILAKVEELESLCGQINSDWEPTLRVVYDGILPFELFLNIYKTFKAEKVPTLIQTYVDYLTDVEKTSNSLKAEIMISVLPINDRGLHTVYLKPLKNYLVACKDHPIHQSKKTWSVEELKEFSFLTIRGSDQKLGLNTQEFEESASFFLSDFSFKKEAIMKNMGFGWLPEHMIEAELKSRLLLPVKWERKSSHEIQPILYMHKSVVSGRAAQQIVDILKK